MNLTPTYSTEQIAAIIDMSSRWVQGMAQRQEITQERTVVIH